jgi:Ca2+/Na+ antiporter
MTIPLQLNSLLMLFTSYLKQKEKFLVIYFLVIGFALFVNLIGVTNDSYEENRNFFTTKSTESQKKESSEFWPFVKFFEKGGYWNPYTKEGEKWSYFNGIFYQFGISEFLAYGILAFVTFYFLWKNRVVKPPPD